MSTGFTGEKKQQLMAGAFFVIENRRCLFSVAWTEMVPSVSQ